MSWAFIAGGSKGIGLGVAKALAKRKYNLLLVARDPDDLAKAKTSLERYFGIQVETLSCDLSIAESFQKISDWVGDRDQDIRILCNAAGLGGSRDFPDLSLAELRTMIRLNLESAVTLSYLFSPILKKTAPAYILNVSSMAGFSPIPVKNIYSSTKSALIFFSYSLKYLLKENDISVSCVCPGPVFTKPAIEKETIKQLGWIGKQMALTADQVGESAAQGMFAKKIIIVPGRMAKILSFSLRLLPHRFMAYISYAFKK